jgi:hypothetical protein
MLDLLHEILRVSRRQLLSARSEWLSSTKTRVSAMCTRLRLSATQYPGQEGQKDTRGQHCSRGAGASPPGPKHNVVGDMMPDLLDEILLVNRRQLQSARSEWLSSRKTRVSATCNQLRPSATRRSRSRSPCTSLFVIKTTALLVLAIVRNWLASLFENACPVHPSGSLHPRTGLRIAAGESNTTRASFRSMEFKEWRPAG